MHHSHGKFNNTFQLKCVELKSNKNTKHNEGGWKKGEASHAGASPYCGFFHRTSP